MKFFIYLIITLILSLNGGKADIYKCIKSAKKYEKIYQLPENLLVSVALTESGKKLKSGEFVSLINKCFPISITLKKLSLAAFTTRSCTFNVS